MRRFWFVKMAAMILLFFTAISALVMVLWNWLLPRLFDLPEINFWQAAGILLFAKIIFGFGHGGKHHHHEGPPWRRRWANKWQHLPEEQREKWKRRFAEKWGCPVEEPEGDKDEKQA